MKDKNSNQYYLHVPLDRITSKKKISRKSETVGLDVGITDLIMLSNGSVYGANSAELFYTLSDNLVNKNKSRLWSYKREIEKKIEAEKDEEKKAKLGIKLKNLEENNLGYKAENGIKETIVNPAYTSQVCCRCNHLGERSGKEFKCSNCNLKIDADFNASINIKKRKEIEEIDIYTSYKQVKEYYENLTV